MKTFSTYPNSIKLRERKKVVREVDPTKFLRKLANYLKTIVTWYVNHKSIVMYKKRVTLYKDMKVVI
jgi:hypothetical protein